MSCQVDTFDVIIVGAGISGLMAARTLLMSRPTMRVQVLEASARTGGRIHTIQTASGDLIELGAQWYHGIEGNPVYKFAEERGLLEGIENMSREEDEMWKKIVPLIEGGEALGTGAGCVPGMRREAGKDIPQADGVFAEVSAAFDDAWEEIMELAEDSKQSCLDYIRSKFEKFAAGSRHDRAMMERCFNAKILLQAAEEGDYLEGLSTVQVSAYQELEGPMIVPCPSGFSAIVSAVEADIPPGVLRTSCRVKRINWGKGGTLVHLESGEELAARHVIVTTSIGVLQAGLIEFEPALPKAKQEAIAQLHIGVVEKVLFEFTEEGFAELERQGLSHAMLVPPSGWESSGDGSTGGLLDDVCEIYRLPGKMFLLGWVVGKGLGKEIGDASDGQLCEELRRVMTRYASDPSSVPLAKSVIKTQWGSDTNFLGSYSCLPLGSGRAQVAALGEPLEGLLFAGEATHCSYYGTVHGGWISGMREAHRVLGCE